MKQKSRKTLKGILAVTLSSCIAMISGFTGLDSYIGTNTVVHAQETNLTNTESQKNHTYQFAELDSGAIKNSYYNITKQFACEKLNGIYFLNDEVLSFYSLSTNEFKKVYEFDGCNDAYIENDKLYIADNTKYYVYDLAEQKLLSAKSITDYQIDAIGADSIGRIYLAVTKTTHSDESATHQIFLYSSDGTLLSKTDEDNQIYAFDGFDSTNGNFYIETPYNWIYWGYDHQGKGISMGNVTDNVIRNVESHGSFVQDYGGISMSQELECIEYCCMHYHYTHKDNAALLGGKYLATSSVAFGRVLIKDSNSEDLKTLMTVGRHLEGVSSGSFYDTSSIGVRAVYNQDHNSIIMYENGKKLSEYNPENGEKLTSADTKYYVFNLLKMGDNVIAIEKDSDKYYIEIMDWTDPEYVAISAATDKMKVGDSQQLTALNGRAYDSKYIWTSSDNSVASVSDTGKLAAWSEGEAVIKCRISDTNIESEYKIYVEKSDITDQKNVTKTVVGTVSNNISQNNYSVWSSVVNSYLMQNKDNTLTRVEYVSGTGVIIETYSLDYKLLNSKTIKCELPIFGGFYSGENNNYLVFGQNNPNENDDHEVVRVVQYDKNWNKVNTCTINGANTYIPFDAGSLRMTETNDLLYIYTCHEMYSDDDDVHHQANMTFVINESDMTVNQSYYDVLNFSQAGYLSHSFNQFIQTDGKYVYRVDHGDANPRGVMISRCLVDGDITDIGGCYALSIPSNYYNYNYTGVSVGGFELSAENCLIVGNSVDLNKSSYNAYGQRNIFVNVKDKKMSKNKTVWLTHYTESDNTTPYTPYLIKLNDEHFCMMWEEYNRNTKKTGVRVACIDENGTMVSSYFQNNLRLSDCQPVVTNDGMVRWYVSNGDKISMYALNPYQNIKTIKGDVSCDKNVNIADALLIAKYDAGLTQFDNIQLKAAEVTGDGEVNIADALMIARYDAGLIDNL